MPRRRPPSAHLRAIVPRRAAFRLVLAAACAFPPAVNPSWATARGDGCCTYACPAPVGTISGCGSLLFNTLAECQAAVASGIAVCAPYSNCPATALTNAVCVDLGTGGGTDTGNGGTGSGTTGGTEPSAELPGAVLLPEGSLLTQSQFDQIAGGFYGLGDVSLLGADYGDAFFNSHYTDSFQNWARDLEARLAAQRDAASRAAADARASPFETGGRDAASTRGYENSYFDELAESDYFFQLQLGRTGAGGSVLMTAEEMERKRLKTESLIANGLPVDYPEKASIEAGADWESKALGVLADEAKKTGRGVLDSYLDKAGVKGAVDDVETAKGILTPYVLGLAEDGMAMANAVARGDFATANEIWEEKIVKSSEEVQQKSQEFTAGKFKDAVSGALGELVEVGLVQEKTKAVYDKAVELGGAAKETLEKVAEKVLEGKKAGLSDAEALAKAAKEVGKEKALEKIVDLNKDLVLDPLKKSATEEFAKTLIPAKAREVIKSIPGAGSDGP